MTMDRFVLIYTPCLLRLSEGHVVPGSIRLTIRSEEGDEINNALIENGAWEEQLKWIRACKVDHEKGWIDIGVDPPRLPCEVIVEYNHKSPPECLYGWMPLNSKMAHGPFTSKTEAVENAKGYYAEDDHPTIVLGTCRYADPLDYLPEVDSLLEQMDEQAFDEDFGWYDGGDIFCCKDTYKEAEEALRQWAKKYLTADKIWTLTKEERITL